MALAHYLIWQIDESHLLQQTFDDTVEIVRKSFLRLSGTQSPSNNSWDSWKKYLPQVLSLRTIYEGRKDKIKPTVTFASLLSDAGTCLFEIGLRNDSILTLELGTDVCAGMEDQDYIVPIYGKICAIHGAILAEIGLSGRKRAIIPTQKALQLRQRQMRKLARLSGTDTKVDHQDDHLLYSNGWNDLGVLLMQNEEFKPAMQYVQRGLEIKQQWITEESFPQKFGESYKNLAYMLVFQGRSAKTVENAKKA